MLHLLLGFKPPLKQTRLPTAGPLIVAGEAKKGQNMQASGPIPPTRPSSYFAGIDRIYQTKVGRGIQEAASPIRGAAQLLSHKEVDEKEEHQPTS